AKQFPRHRRQYEKGNEKAHPAVGDKRARKHDSKDRPALPQPVTHEMGDGMDRSAVVHELSEQRAEQEYREELRNELRRAAHESLRPMGEQGFSGQGGSDHRHGWRKEEHAPSAERQPHQEAKGNKDTGESHIFKPAAKGYPDPSKSARRCSGHSPRERPRRHGGLRRA